MELTQPDAANPASLPCSRSSGFGPWGLGTENQPLDPKKLADFLAENTVRGGLRLTAETYLAEDQDNIFCTKCHDTEQPPPFQRTCYEKHPGFCKGRDETLSDAIRQIAAKLNTLNAKEHATGLDRSMITA